MTHSEAPISINLKTTAGTQLTLRANTPDEFTMLTSQVFSIVEAIEEVEKAVRGTGSSAPAATPVDPAIGYLANAMGGQVVTESWNSPQATFAPTPPPMGTGQRMCPHGSMTRIHGLSGKFGPYKGHFCPAKQGDPSKCATQYVKQTSPDWATFTADSTKQ
jgi:hypothetical protein